MRPDDACGTLHPHDDGDYVDDDEDDDDDDDDDGDSHDDDDDVDDDDDTSRKSGQTRGGGHLACSAWHLDRSHPSLLLKVRNYCTQYNVF